MLPNNQHQTHTVTVMFMIFMVTIMKKSGALCYGQLVINTKYSPETSLFLFVD